MSGQMEPSVATGATVDRPTGPPIIRSFGYRNMGRILPTLNPLPLRCPPMPFPAKAGFFMPGAVRAIAVALALVPVRAAVVVIHP